MKSQILELFQRTFGSQAVGILDLRGDGSNRRLFRLRANDGTSVVGVAGPNHYENRAFIAWSRSLGGIGLPVPEILATDESSGIYLESDLGDTTLFDALCMARATSGFDGGVPPESVRNAYHSVVRLLPRVQVEGGRVIDYNLAYPCAEFDRTSMMWDLNYFKYHFLKLAHIPFHEARLERDFLALTERLATIDNQHFMYRDFQSRNIMLVDGAPWLIDYQGGRRGALQYDLASLLYDARADLSEAFRSELTAIYLDALSDIVRVDPERFRADLPVFALIRILQAMGAYGYRGYFERKPHFLASVPYAVANIARILQQGLPIDLPELSAVLGRVISKEGQGEARILGGGLQVAITSFSYRRGYPGDTTGHGGGFVFDCRSIHNPGRYPEYRDLSGCDLPVIEFLEHQQEASSFWQGVVALVDPAIQRYIDRGFEHLSVGFGCTGGQHRSVYLAERLARHIAKHFPSVTLEIVHRERENWPSRNP